MAGFLAEVGDLRRFESPRQIQKLVGLSLKENSSGKHKGQTTISKRGRSRLRAILFNAVIPLIATNAEFRELHRYYTTRTVNPLKKKQSVIAISCKLIRVFYAILTKGAIYDGEKITVRYTPQSSDSIKTKRDFQEDVHRKIFGRIRRKEELHEEPKVRIYSIRAMTQ